MVNPVTLNIAVSYLSDPKVSVQEKVERVATAAFILFLLLYLFVVVYEVFLPRLILY
jgi:hypothetical protein